MSTGRDLIRRSLVLLGVLSEGETPTAQQLTDGLLSANEMLDSWSTENLTIYSNTKETFTSPSGNGAPTMGPTTGTFATTRPVEIEMIMAKSGNTELPVELLNFEQWAAIADKTATGSLPAKAYIDYGSPLLTINLYPVPSAGVDIVIYSRKPLTSLAANTSISIPPGYMRAIRYNLAIELATEFGRQASAEVVQVAKESKANIKRQNKQTNLMVADGMVSGRRAFNIFTGE
jgi:hypothetical protein